MQTPPPFHGYEGSPQMPKKKNNTVVIILAVLGGLLLCCGLPLGVGVFYGVKGFKGAMNIGGCMANVSMMQQALREYSKEHDGKLPSAKNWQAEIGKYLTTSKDMDGAPIKFWKAGGEWACEDSGNKTGFMFNESYSEKKVADVTKANPEAIVIFETKTVAFNQSGPFTKLPFDQSPKYFGEFSDERRGWMMINADASHIYTYNKNGKLSKFNMDDMKSSKKDGSFNFKIDTNSSDDSKDSKADNSN